MKRDSIRLAWAGALIGVLALSATVTAKIRPWPIPTELTEALAADSPGKAVDAKGRPGEQAGMFKEDRDAVPAMAEQRAGRAFLVALRVRRPAQGDRLFLCDSAGNPLEAISPDTDGDASLGPIPPGQYGIWNGGTELGRFRLLENAALAEAEGHLQTDGELLWLERSVKNDLSFRK